MAERPKIKLALKTIDKIFEIVAWLLIVAVWVLSINQYPYLPNTIPIHFNEVGEADRFGGKEAIMALPSVATIVFIGLSILNKFPEIFNYPVRITQDNALRQYTNATRLLRLLKLIIVFIFGLIIFKTIQYSNGATKGFGLGFLLLIIGLFYIPIIYFVIKAYKTK